MLARPIPYPRGLPGHGYDGLYPTPRGALNASPLVSSTTRNVNWVIMRCYTDCDFEFQSRAFCLLHPFYPGPSIIDSRRAPELRALRAEFLFRQLSGISLTTTPGLVPFHLINAVPPVTAEILPFCAERSESL